METQPYTNREMDMKFQEIKDILHNQNDDLNQIKINGRETNGKVAQAFLEIAKNKSDSASNWRAIQVGTSIFVLVVIPLCGIIYYNIQGSIKLLQSQIHNSQK